MRAKPFQSMYAPLAIFGAALLFGCSKSADGTHDHEMSPLPKGLRIGMEYQQHYKESKDIYIFGKEGVSVYGVIDNRGDIYRNETDGSFMLAGTPVSDGLMTIPLPSGKPRGARGPVSWAVVVLGPGERMPVLENAFYKVEGTSVYVDWSQHHSKYFSVSGCDSGSEVWNIKNDGLILESATIPGDTLTLNMTAAPVSMQDVLNNQSKQLREQNVGAGNP